MLILLASLLLLAVPAVLFGLGLAYASDFCRIDTDPKVDEIIAVLPQVNCGACGYKGCASYAEAVAKREAATNKCTPGGADMARKVAAIMGVAAESVTPKSAIVHCQGGTPECPDRFDYFGVRDCHAAVLVQAGPKGCMYGCLGFATCADACPFGAITMTASRLPRIDPRKCTSCGICVKACPRDLIEVLPLEHKVYLGCANHDRGKAVKAVCSRGCITCHLCVKKTASGAITMVNDLPVIDYSKGRDFDEAVDKCPSKCFVVQDREVEHEA